MAMVPCLHHGTTYIERKLRVWRDHKCIPLVGSKTPLNCVGRHTISSQGMRHSPENGNLCKLGWTYRHGTVFAPWHYLHQKKATGMEKPETYSPSRCKKPTYLCDPSNYPVSKEVVLGRERKFAPSGVDLSPWYRVCTKAIFISKGSYGYGETINVVH